MKTRHTLKGRVWNGREKELLLRSWLPYGKWTCADGREVLFNRFYEPIWERADGVTKLADHEEWVKNTVDRGWFFKDGNPPWRNRTTLEECLRHLREFGATWEPIAHYADVRRAA